MKKNKDLKKLALMGMAAGMLLSSEKVEASFADQAINPDVANHLAAGCGGRGKCSGVVAERSAPQSYSYGSCNHSNQPSYGSCNHSNQPSYGSCNHSNQPSYGYSQSQNQGYYDPSQWAAGNQTQPNAQNPQGSQNPQTNSQPNRNYQSANNNTQNQTNPKGTLNSNNPNKYQASGCGGKHGCNGDNASKYEASNSCGGRNPSNNSGNNYYNPGQIADANTPANTTGKLNESDLLTKLNDQGKATYNTLSPEQKKIALEMANQECKGKNNCKGMNSCKTDTNECAGKGGCKGKAKGPFLDKNLAVKVAASKGADKRLNLQNKNGM